MTHSKIDAEQILANSEEIVSAEEVQNALSKMAAEITSDLAELDPVVLVVMNGALIPAGLLLTHLSFPFKIGYLHATRYRGETTGGDIVWKALPSIDIKHETVLLIDDIYDEGTTLEAITKKLLSLGAKKVYTATLVNKVHDRKPQTFSVDYVGFDVPDRYVFGCGMDCNEYWRNLASIWALK